MTTRRNPPEQHSEHGRSGYRRALTPTALPWYYSADVPEAA